ncbi:MAG: hypothetical protein Q8M37_04395 [Nevskia sp.]|nr:hypothetical protein [Nevskia sp.]
MAVYRRFSRSQQEPERTNGLIAGAPRQLPLLQQMQQVVLNLLDTQDLRGAPVMPGQPGNRHLRSRSATAINAIILESSSRFIDRPPES